MAKKENTIRNKLLITTLNLPHLTSARNPVRGKKQNKNAAMPHDNIANLIRNEEYYDEAIRNEHLVSNETHQEASCEYEEGSFGADTLASVAIALCQPATSCPARKQCTLLTHTTERTGLLRILHDGQKIYAWSYVRGLAGFSIGKRLC